MTTEQKNNHALILRTNGEFEIIDWPTTGARGHLETLYCPESLIRVQYAARVSRMSSAVLVQMNGLGFL
ncbi:hypothetical protein ABZ691_21070, partial [Streptomyces sp. NPDC006854]|uniref:hypothetical protein n=1 Tax=Streptomyces sp. NPDC006854 TaxID=3155115 RepID=UPI0033D2F697